MEWLSTGGASSLDPTHPDSTKKHKKLSKKAALALVSEAQESAVALANRKKLFTNLYVFDSLEEGHLVRSLKPSHVITVSELDDHSSSASTGNSVSGSGRGRGRGVGVGSVTSSSSKKGGKGKGGRRSFDYRDPLVILHEAEATAKASKTSSSSVKKGKATTSLLSPAAAAAARKAAKSSKVSHPYYNSI